MLSAHSAFIAQESQHLRTLRTCLAAGIVAHLLAFLLVPPFTLAPFDLLHGKIIEVIQMEHPKEIEIQLLPKEIDRSQLGNVLAEVEAVPDVNPFIEFPEVFSPFSRDPDPGLTVGAIPFSVVEVLPQVLRSVTPEYPEIARDAGAEGTVKVLVTVARTGRVRDARIIDSDTVPVLKQAALAAALKYLFSSGKQQGRAVESQVVLTFTFELR